MTDSSDDDFVLVPSLDRPNLNSAPAALDRKEKRFNVLAIISLAASLSSFIGFLGIGGLVGIVTGHLALRQIKQHGGPGRGMALVGLTAGYVTFIAAAIVLVVVFLLGGFFNHLDIYG